jgi:hypothetical protein
MHITRLAALLAVSALASPALAQAPVPASATVSTGPANICTELVAFLTPKPPAPAANTAPGQPPAQAAGTSQPQQQAQTGAAAGTQPTGVSPNAAQTQAQGGSAQSASNQSGAAVEAPNENNAAAKPASGQNAPQTSGISAPIPKAPETTKKAPTMSLEQGQALASANDIAGCKNATVGMRREGVDMPPALMALAALDLRFQQAAPPVATDPQTPPPGAAQ